MPPHLVALPPLPPAGLGPVASVAFCSHCGASPSASRFSRVCPHCEMGLLLRAHPDLAPAEGDAFLVCDLQLRVCALSRGAEVLLGAFEPAVIHAPVGEFVQGIARDAGGAPSLPRMLREAAAGLLDIGRTFVAPGGRSEDACPARVGACGLPPAALLVIDAPVP